MSKFRRKNKGMSAGLRNNDASEKHLFHRFQTLKSTTLKMKSLAQELVRACHLRLVKVVEAFRNLVEELMNVTLHAFESSLSFAPRAHAPLACIFHSSPVLSIRMPATGTGLVGPPFIHSSLSSTDEDDAIPLCFTVMPLPCFNRHGAV